MYGYMKKKTKPDTQTHHSGTSSWRWYDGDLDSFVALIVHKLSTASSTVYTVFPRLSYTELKTPEEVKPSWVNNQTTLEEGDVNVSIKQRWTKPRQQIKSSICSSLKVYTSILSLFLSVRVKETIHRAEKAPYDDICIWMDETSSLW